MREKLGWNGGGSSRRNLKTKKVFVLQSEAEEQLSKQRQRFLFLHVPKQTSTVSCR